MESNVWKAVPNVIGKDGQAFIVTDGAMSTFLHQIGLPLGVLPEQLNLENPEQVRSVHEAYVNAGATLIQTNTFSASRFALSRVGIENQFFQIHLSAVNSARQAAASQAAVFGSIGALPVEFIHENALSPERMEREYRRQIAEQAEALLQAGVDGFVLETFAESEWAYWALSTVRSLTNLPIIVNLSPDEIGVTRDGMEIGHAFQWLQQAGADAVGLNCRLGPYGILRSYESLHLEKNGMYAAIPNAGLLHFEEGKYAYTGNAEYFSKTMLDLARHGVRILGGCCGTTPEHIQRLRKVLEETVFNESSTQSVLSAGKEEKSGETSVSDLSETPKIEAKIELLSNRNQSLVEKVAQKRTVIVELDPPKTLDCSKFLRGASILAESGADFLTLADNSLGSIRVSNLALAALLKQRGIEPLVHIACRDRNLIGQQSHLMGLYVLDIHHILLVTGDPSRFGDLPGATSVFDVSSTELTRMVKRLNGGIGFSGMSLEPASRFVIGTSFNPHVRNFDKAVERLRRKIEAGADYIMTQPVYDVKLIKRLAEVAKDLTVPMFVGVMPLVSARNAQYLHHQVPGIQIPETILRLMDEAEPSQALHVGMDIARELVNSVLEHFRGIYLVTPFLRYSLTAELTRYAKSLNHRSISV
ncbi:bifunctional homocysteine S-methyltransferase/methylenetetrahydrofolate reductase [Alicyclobacillus tolerans]|uniref:bifunctional homocysteine S-methyltransferase/methylenetetrahydrofolate reductase n=1 Tax=Alicyclobacillus tolerans TaxID=90970 RepID=UPI003B7B158A